MAAKIANTDNEITSWMTLSCVARHLAVPQAVRGHLQRVLREGDQPADQDRGQKSDVLVLEVAVPGDRHERVGRDKQQNHDQGCLHGRVVVEDEESPRTCVRGPLGYRVDRQPTYGFMGDIGDIGFVGAPPVGAVIVTCAFGFIWAITASRSRIA